MNFKFSKGIESFHLIPFSILLIMQLPKYTHHASIINLCSIIQISQLIILILNFLLLGFIFFLKGLVMQPQIQIVVIKHYLITYYFSPILFTLFIHIKILFLCFPIQDVILNFLNLLPPFNNSIFKMMYFINVSSISVQMSLLCLSKSILFSLNYPMSNLPLLMIPLGLVKELQFLISLILFLILNPATIYEAVIILIQVLFQNFNAIQIISDFLLLSILYFSFLLQISWLNFLRLVNDLRQAK